MACVTWKPMALSGRWKWGGRKCRCFLRQLARSPWEWIPVLLASMQIFSWNPMGNNDTAYSKKGSYCPEAQKKGHLIHFPEERHFSAILGYEFCICIDFYQKLIGGNFPGNPVFKNFAFQCRGLWVWSLVGAVGSHMLQGQKPRDIKQLILWQIQ